MSEFKCNYCGTDNVDFPKHNCVDVLNQRLRDAKRVEVAALAEIDRLRSLLKQVVDKDFIDWHEWSCISTHHLGHPCDCGGEQLRAEVAAEIAAHEKGGEECLTE